MAPRERHALMGLLPASPANARSASSSPSTTSTWCSVTPTRVLVLNRGMLIAEGAPGEVRANAEVQAVYLGAGSLYGAHS